MKSFISWIDRIFFRRRISYWLYERQYRRFVEEHLRKDFL